MLAETAVVDINPKLAEDCARELSIQAFTDIQSALKWNPDGVVVATPTNLHIPVAMASVESGANVLIEKPISNSLDGVDAFLKRSESLGRIVFVVCNMRFHPGISALHRNLDLIGRPFFARAHVGNFLPKMRPNSDYRKLYCASKAKGGGVILDAIHEIDYLMWFFGMVQKVICDATRLSDLEIDVEDYACIFLRHENNVAAEIQMDYLRPFKRRGCEIVGDQGILLWQSEGKNPEKCSVRLYERKTEKWKPLLYSENVDINSPYKTLMKHFIAGIQGHDVPLLKGREAAEELSVALLALQKSQQGGDC
jgi:predicted dehydrogenase